jgi:GT2 family glycosyltransferase
MPALDAGRLGVVVLTHGTGGVFVPLVEALVAEGVPAGAITVVHNPTEPGQPAPEAPIDDVAVLGMPRNGGYSGGMNRGLRAQLDRGADRVLVLTHEVRFRPGSIRALVAAADELPAYGILGPALWWPERETIFSYGGRHGRAGGVEHMTERPAGSNGRVIDCEWIDGAAMLIRAAVLERVGLLDGRFFIYYEENELCLRTARAGWKIGVVPDALAEQSPGASRRPGAYAYLITRNGFEFARLAAGPKGVAGAAKRTALELNGILRTLASRGTPDDERWNARVRLRGTALGVLDFVRRRWGPPPERLAGLGDTRGTG